MSPLVLTVALFLLACGRLTSAVPTAVAPSETPSSPTDSPDKPPLTSRHPSTKDEATLVFGSGLQIPASAHRRLLDALKGHMPFTLKMASGEERHFPSGNAHLAELRGPGLEGVEEVVVPAETFPVGIVRDVIETDFAHRAHIVRPDGEDVSYADYMGFKSLTSRAPLEHGGHGDPEPAQLFHRQYSDFGEDADEDELQVLIGGSQRLGIKVYEAIIANYKEGKPFDVVLMTGGKHVQVDTYEELLRRLVNSWYLGAKVQLNPHLKVPIETYRAVVNADNRVNGVYVVDKKGHRMLYSVYKKQRGSNGTSTL